MLSMWNLCNGTLVADVSTSNKHLGESNSESNAALTCWSDISLCTVAHSQLLLHRNEIRWTFCPGIFSWPMLIVAGQPQAGFCLNIAPVSLLNRKPYCKHRIHQRTHLLILSTGFKLQQCSGCSPILPAGCELPGNGEPSWGVGRLLSTWSYA